MRNKMSETDPSGIEHGSVDWRMVLKRQKEHAGYMTKWLDLLDLNPGDRLVDVGCGPGFSALLAAARVGGSGTVFAVDRSAEALTVLMEEAKRHGLRNIVRLEGTVEEVLLAPESATHALMSNVLHHSQRPSAMVKVTASLLIPEGKILVVEALPGSGVGSNSRLPQKVVRSYVEDAGLYIKEEGVIEPLWYFILAEKPARYS